MNALLQLLHTVTRHLRAAGIDHAVVGGITVAFWGRPRATEDIDILMAIHPDQLADLHAYLEDHDIRMDLEDARARLADGRSFPLFDTWSVHWVDARPPTTGLDHHVLEHAVEIELQEEAVRVASPEDTILSKLAAGRDQDLLDARSILLRQGDRLDRAHVEARVEQHGLDAPWRRAREGT